MARPRKYDSDLVAQELLDVFWLRGYADTSITNLTEATGLLPGSLYAAFGDKEGMFRVAVSRYTSHLASNIPTDGSGIDAVQAILQAIVDLTARDPERRGCLILNSIPQSQQFSEGTRQQLQRGMRGMRGLVRARLLEAQEESGSSADIGQLAALVSAASIAIRVLGRAGETREQLQAIADGAVMALRRCLEQPA